MLTRLYIKNFTLIDTLDIELRPGFSVITGETGAGKSIIIGAIGLLLGQRADQKAIKGGTAKCVVEAHFDLTNYALDEFFAQNDIEYDAADCIVRRELTAAVPMAANDGSGAAAKGAVKSRAFINDTPVALSLLKELGERLMDIHSQHQNLLLQTQDFQLSVVDILADNGVALADYRQTFARYQEKSRELQQLKDDMERTRQAKDFMQFQADELADARLVPGEQEELEQKAETMAHSEDIKSALYEADRALSGEETGVVTQLRQATAALHAIERVFPTVAPLAERMDSVHIELKDIAQDISAGVDDVDFDPAELDRVNARLDRLYDLQKKYRTDSVEELISLHQDLQRQLELIENSDEAIAQLNSELQQLAVRLSQQAQKLTASRRKAAKLIEQEMQQRLTTLGMPSVRFAIDMQEQEPGRNGQDKVSFLFSANTSSPLQPVSQVASGGEVARVMLSLKAMISGAVKLPTIIFDEIDTGVSGKMAERMAKIMQEMGRNGRQVISITHLPQIAALGATHYKVSKREDASGTVTQMTLLAPEERVAEIAAMLSGSDVTPEAIANARQLLKQ